MRFSPAIGAWIFIVVASVVPAHAQEQASLQARVAARRELELARIDLRNYWQIDYPRQKRFLDGAIELTEAEVDGYDKQVLALRPYTSFSIGQPFPLTIQCLKMNRRAAELRLDDLRAERNNLVRFHGDQFNALQLRVIEARLRVAALEANDTPETPPAMQSR